MRDSRSVAICSAPWTRAAAMSSSGAALVQGDEISDLGMTTVVDEMGEAGGRGATACRNSDAPGQPGGHGRLVKVEGARQVSGFLGRCDREFRGHVLRARLFIHKASG